MRKSILFLLMLIAHSYHMQSMVVVQADSVLHDNLRSGYEVDVVSRSNKLHVDYKFDSIAIVADPIFKGTHNVFIGGFGNMAIEGKAALPTLLERFAIPPGCTYSVTNVSAKYISLSAFLAPARPIIPEISEWSFNTVPVKPIVNTNAFEPESPVSDCGMQVFRALPLANVEITPIAYNSSLHRLRICTELHFDIEYIENGSSSAFEYDEDTDLYVKSITLQPKNDKEKALLSDKMNATESEVDYLIITATSLNTAARKLAAWKRKLGYRVYTFSRSSWDKNDVIEAISLWYQDMKNPRFVLLIGDENLISPYEMIDDGNYKKIPSDFKYACMDGDNDHIADVFMGRIPGSDLAEVENAIEKIISYEMNPIGDMPETKVVYSSFFQDEKPQDGYEDRDFVRTTELLYNAFPDKFDNRSRIYFCESSVSPSHWSDTFSYGGEIPIELRKPHFAWDGDADDIITEINSGCSLFFHRDHGATYGWGDPYFTTWHLSRLENQVFPIVLSIDCLTGKYNASNNFAKSMLCMPDAGCASIIAASGVTYSGYNDAMVCAMFSSVFPEAKFIYNDSPDIKRNAELFNGKASSIGEMLNIGLINMERHYNGYSHTMELQRSRYHCFGDPSLSICWSSSNILRQNASITEFGGFITVDLGMTKAYISFYEESTSRRKRVYGNYVTFEAANPEDVHISIMSPGYIPVIGTYKELATLGADNPKDNYIKSFELNGDWLNVELEMKYGATFEPNGGWKLNTFLQSNVAAVSVSSVEIRNFNLPIEIRLPETKNGDIIRLTLTRGNEIVDKKAILIKK